MAIVALHSSQTGLTALNTKLDVIANNLANVNTDGFKGSRTNFQDLLYQEKRLPGVENAAGDESPTGLYVGLGVRVSGTQVDFRQGPLRQTDQDLDLAIEGEGFFKVRVPESISPTGFAYTRSGNFFKNEDGELVLGTDQGFRLDPSITIDPEATKIAVSSDGQVYAQVPGSEEPQNQGQILLTSFVNPKGLRQAGSNLFVESAASGDPVESEPGEGPLGLVRSGVLEGSNVDPTLELVELIRTQRAFEMNSQVIRAADETLRAVGQLRR